MQALLNLERSRTKLARGGYRFGSVAKACVHAP
jgi:hypothetical protein